MKCPYCECTESKVIDSRPVDDGASIRRRRECLKCEKRFTTYEQVESVRLMSGAYDIIVSVNGSNIREISLFVSQRLATIDAVQSTATHFVLNVYKENGILISNNEIDERGLISP